ncbi:hypothetical protein [Salinispora pacifica]|nr:hypothetical protein [Salinispora pacifica]
MATAVPLNTYPGLPLNTYPGLVVTPNPRRRSHGRGVQQLPIRKQVTG